MKAAAPESTDQPPAQSRLVIPLDLSTWADKPLLLQWVVEEIDSLDWTNPELVQYLRANPAFRPRFNLVLMIYAYALGRYDSDEVVDLYFSEANLRRLFPEQNPNSKGVRRFRREHRGLLRWGLAQVLKRALRFRFELGESAAIPAGLNRLLTEVATDRLGAARHFDRSIQGE
jgi:hypothetical protein